MTCRYGTALGENDALTALALADDLSTPLLVTDGEPITHRPMVAEVDDRPHALGPWEIALVRSAP